MKNENLDSYSNCTLEEWLMANITQVITHYNGPVPNKIEIQYGIIEDQSADLLPQYATWRYILTDDEPDFVRIRIYPEAVKNYLRDYLISTDRDIILELLYRVAGQLWPNYHFKHNPNNFNLIGLEDNPEDYHHYCNYSIDKPFIELIYQPCYCH
jgi:hypothetical protein